LTELGGFSLRMQFVHVGSRVDRTGEAGWNLRLSSVANPQEAGVRMSWSAAEQRARRLELATIAWNVLEVFVTIGLGIAAGSLALIAFGLDSIAEIFASTVVLWHLRAQRDVDRTRRALRLVGVAFFVLAAVLIAAGVRNLVIEHRPDDSPWGVVYLALTAGVMFGLAIAKRRTSKELGNHPLVHEARVTFLDGMLAVGILLALVMNAAFGWWWADSISAIVIGIIAVFEGIAAPQEH
jgi:divalent metal cation (Fe/Co/Zn/Cd) transporter